MFETSFSVHKRITEALSRLTFTPGEPYRVNVTFNWGRIEGFSVSPIDNRFATNVFKPGEVYCSGWRYGMFSTWAIIRVEPLTPEVIKAEALHTPKQQKFYLEESFKRAIEAALQAAIAKQLELLTVEKNNVVLAIDMLHESAKF